MTNHLQGNIYFNVNFWSLQERLVCSILSPSWVCFLCLWSHGIVWEMHSYSSVASRQGPGSTGPFPHACPSAWNLLIYRAWLEWLIVILICTIPLLNHNGFSQEVFVCCISSLVSPHPPHCQHKILFSWFKSQNFGVFSLCDYSCPIKLFTKINRQTTRFNYRILFLIISCVPVDQSVCYAHEVLWKWKIIWSCLVVRTKSW